jgi:hypothetical protein
MDGLAGDGEFLSFTLWPEEYSEEYQRYGTGRQNCSIASAE